MKDSWADQVGVFVLFILVVTLSFKIDNLEKENKVLKDKVMELMTDDETGVVGHPKAAAEAQEIGVL